LAYFLRCNKQKTDCSGITLRIALKTAPRSFMIAGLVFASTPNNPRHISDKCSLPLNGVAETPRASIA